MVRGTPPPERPKIPTRRERILAQKAESLNFRLKNAIEAKDLKAIKMVGLESAAAIEEAGLKELLNILEQAREAQRKIEGSELEF